MKKFAMLALVLSLVLLAASCSKDPLTEPTSDRTTAPQWATPTDTLDPEMIAGEILAVTGWEMDTEVDIPQQVLDIDGKCLGRILDYSREVLTGNVAHYTFLLSVGPGEFDKIQVHRVVKERRPHRPKRCRDSIFLQHGDAVGFLKFLYGAAAPSVPDDHAAAIYLAQNGVDVWGIDQNWVLVPEETASFGFMENWGMDNQIANLRTGMAVARLSRLFTGNGFGKMHLLGYSSGGSTGYAYINDEATRPYWQRHAKGYICADMTYKYSPEEDEFRQNACGDVEYFGSRFDGGEFEEFIPFVALGQLAANDPEGESPFIPGFNNLQSALYFSAATFDIVPANAWWHYFGGVFDPETGLPVDLHFTTIDGMADFMQLGCPWESLRFMLDYSRIMCDEEDVPWDDHLSSVEIPVLLLEPAGGLGSSARYSLELLGSSDIQIATASLMPEEQIVEDFGHIDMWTAEQAPALVWQPMLEWITGHRHQQMMDSYPVEVNLQ